MSIRPSLKCLNAEILIKNNISPPKTAKMVSILIEEWSLLIDLVSISVELVYLFIDLVSISASSPSLLACKVSIMTKEWYPRSVKWGNISNLVYLFNSLDYLFIKTLSLLCVTMDKLQNWFHSPISLDTKSLKFPHSLQRLDTSLIRSNTSPQRSDTFFVKIDTSLIKIDTFLVRIDSTPLRMYHFP